MTVQYNLYANEGTGGEVNYDSVIGVTGLLQFSASPVPAPSDWWFAVRAADSVTGLEEKNTDARVRVRIDASGVDITAQPNEPVGLTAEAIVGGKIRVHWVSPRPGAPDPTGYHVYIGVSLPSYTTPAATVNHTGARAYSTDLGGLVDGTTYTVAVRAFNGVAEEKNVKTASAKADATGPDPVDGFTILAVFGS